MSAGSRMLIEYRLPHLERHARVRRRIVERRLPLHLPDRIIAGHGSGSKCAACDQPVNADEIEYDVEDPRNDAARLNLHLECYLVWQIECVKRLREQREDDPSDQPAPSDQSTSETAGGNGRARMTRHQ